MIEKTQENKNVWMIVALDQIIEVQDHLRKPINAAERALRIAGKSINELYPYYGATGQVGYIDEYITDGSYVLIGEDAAPFFDNTKPVAYKISGKTWVNNHAHVLKPLINPEFCLHYLNNFNYSGYVEGTTRLKLTQGALKRIPVPVPPLAEQHRIVAKIEELFSELDKGIETLKTTQQQLKVYRQAVLKSAFEGKLTLVNRESGIYPDSITLVKSLKNLGKENSIKLKYDLLLNNADLPQIPSTWKWLRNEELLKYVTSGSRDWKKFYSDKGSIFIRTQDIKTNLLDLKNAAFVNLPENVEGKRSRVEAGDILMTITGANVGKVAVVPEGILEAYVSQSVALMKLLDNRMSKYLLYYFQSRTYGEGLIGGLVYGVGRPVLSLENMREVPVALCSLEEQDDIVQEIESRLSVCDKIEESIEQGLQQAESLRQSILKKAFEGKLVPQDPNDEPASVLLERIKAERAAAQPVKKTRTKKVIS
jgi:type I restriction enzyme S subunit